MRSFSVWEHTTFDITESDPLCPNVVSQPSFAQSAKQFVAKMEQWMVLPFVEDDEVPESATASSLVLVFEGRKDVKKNGRQSCLLKANQNGPSD